MNNNRGYLKSAICAMLSAIACIALLFTATLRTNQPTWLVLFAAVFLIVSFAFALRMGRSYIDYAVGALKRDLKNHIRSESRSTIIGISCEMHAMHVLLERFPQCKLPTTSYSIRFTNLLEIVRTLDSRRPERIVELGSGISSLCIAAWLQEQGRGMLYSFDHDSVWAECTRKQLASSGLKSFAQVIHAPLTEGPHRRSSDWYDLHAWLPKIGPIDFLLVDGPPAGSSEQRLARFPAVEELGPHLNEAVAIAIDDANRTGEKEVVAAWLKNYPRLRSTTCHTLTGLVILQSALSPNSGGDPEGIPMLCDEASVL